MKKAEREKMAEHLNYAINRGIEEGIKVGEGTVADWEHKIEAAHANCIKKPPPEFSAFLGGLALGAFMSAVAVLMVWASFGPYSWAVILYQSGTTWMCKDLGTKHTWEAYGGNMCASTDEPK